MAAALVSLGLPLAVHIADGMLRTPWLAGGFALAGLLTLLASYKVRDEEIPRIALLSAAFFVATLMHLPLGPASVHLLLNGLVGVVLGRRAPLAISIGLVLQAVLFGHGGFTSLGVNACVQILPALLAAWLFAVLRRLPLVRRGNGTALWLIGCLIGVTSVLAALVLKALVLLGGGAADWRPIVQLEFLAHLPVAAIEGVVLGFTVSFLARVKPEMLGLKTERQGDKETRRQGERRFSLSPCLLVSLSSVLLAANTAHAHRLDAGYVVLPDRQVRVEAWFDLGGGAPKGAAVKVFRSAQRLLAAGQLDDNGCFTFRFADVEPLEVTIAAADGHGKTFVISPERLLSAVEESPGNPVASPREADRPFHVIDSAAVWRERLKEALIGLSFLFSLAAFLLSWRNGRWLRAFQQSKHTIADTAPSRKE